MQFVYSGYVDDEAKTQESFLPDGWWRTGDIAMLDSKYDVYCINGRSKERFFPYILWFCYYMSFGGP